MKLNLQFEPISLQHVNTAVDLVISAYKEEREALPFLPTAEDFVYPLSQSIKSLFTHGSGIAAIRGNELVGFLAGWQIEELFGKEKGVYIPLFGNGAITEQRKHIYQEMYQHAAGLWTKKGLLSHVATFFAHDQKTIDTWFWMGFGLRCVDAIRRVSPITTLNSDIIIRKAALDDVPVLAELHREHNHYYKHSPIFMPREDEDPVLDLTEWLAAKNRHLWIAYSAEEPVGYMRIQPAAESFVSEHPAVMNITGAYVSPDARKSHIGTALLETVQQWLQKNGFSLCGVDFESFNTLGSNFWQKYFTPYTYSMVRRIDERIYRE